MNKIKFITLISLFCLLFIIPNAFALDNDTAISQSDSGVLEKAYYFDANIENNTGDGSVNNPFKSLSPINIEDNSVLYLAEGNYNLTGHVNVNNVTIIGKSPQNTIIYNSGTGIDVRTTFVLRNITLNNLAIDNHGSIRAENVVFNSSYNSNGGAIESNEGSTATYVDLDNCTFSNNHAKYGGAINAKNCVLTISNSIFINNYAEMYGGAIAADADVNCTIRKSKFINDYSINDAGGALYLFNANNFRAENVEFTNCSSSFGGAIASLRSNLTLIGITAKDNRALHYGGAIYAIYGVLGLNRSAFYNNTGLIGGALYIDEVYDFIPYYNTFANNNAGRYANAVYSSISEYLLPNSVLDITFHNSVNKNDVFESNLPDLNITSKDYMLIRYNDTHIVKIPSKYDLRQLNQVTPVKDQGSNGNCWAFSSLAALESCILKATGIALDLSEENMKNLMSLYSDYGWAMEPNKGGYDKMGIGYLTGWLGPVNESDDRYYTNGVLSPVLESFIHIQNIVYLTRTDYTDNDAIKKAIMQYGAVSTSVYWSSSNINRAFNSYYYSGDKSANHAVAIVGWDDNFSKDNFKTAPQGNGAWIIKNSWGNSSGENGYFYVSYYDTRLAPINRSESTFTFVLNDSRRFDKNYQYDISGKTDYFLNATHEVWYRNRFTASNNEYLSAVSTYFREETSWQLSIYVNNVLKLTKSGKSSPSYSTIYLDKNIPLKIGDVFVIEFKISVKGDTGVPISESISLNREIYGPNISYISYDGEKWADFYELEWAYPDHTYASQVACIKAFTIINRNDNSTDIESLNLSIQANDVDTYLDSEYRYSVMLVDDSNNPLVDKLVRFTVDGKTFTSVTNRQGIAKLDFEFTIGTHKVAILSPAEGKYVSSSSSANVNVKSTIVLPTDKVYAFNSVYSATILGSDGKPLANAEVNISIDSDVYQAVSDSNGRVSHVIDMDPGKYTVIVKNLANGDYASQLIEVTSRISENSDLKMYFAAEKYFTVKVVGDNGEIVKNLRVTFNVDGRDYYGYSDENGYASFMVDLKPGTYTVTSSYNGFSVENKIVVKKTLITKDVTVRKGKTIKFTAKLLGTDGKILKNKKITFKFKGKKYKVRTNSKGKATLKISNKYKVGKYKIKTGYGAAKVSNIITIKK